MSSPRHPPFTVLAFLGLSLLWILTLALVATGLLTAFAGVSAGGVRDALVQTRPLWMFTVVQTSGLVLIAALLGRWSGRRWEQLFPRPKTGWLFVALAALGALALGPASGFIAGLLDELWPDLGGAAMAQIFEALFGGALIDRVLLGLVIVLLAGVAEELIFRGFVWDALQRAYGPTAAWLLSSLLFAAYHLNPVQSVALIPLSLFIGWLRLRSGSVLPSIAAHVANNGFALVVTLALGVRSDEQIPASFAALSVGLCAIILLVAAKLGPQKER